MKEFAMKIVMPFLTLVVLLTLMLALTMVLSGCASTMKKATESASGKNLGLDGYVMMGELEAANPETATPQGRLIIGRVTYKSRKVGIPADQKVPTTGYFKATRTKSLFGTEEQIVEYDFTAGSDSDAKKALEVLEEKRKAAEKSFAAQKEADHASENKGEAGGGSAATLSGTAGAPAAVVDK